MTWMLIYLLQFPDGLHEHGTMRHFVSRAHCVRAGDMLFRYDSRPAAWRCVPEDARKAMLPE